MFDEDELDPAEYPDEHDLHCGNDDDTDGICPSCRQYVYYDAPKCPHCGDWILRPESAPSGPSQSPWIRTAAATIVVLAIVGLLVAAVGLAC